MKVFFPQERDQVVLVVRVQRDTIEAGEESFELGTLDSRVERQTPQAVAIEKKSQAVFSVEALVDDFVPTFELELVHGELNLSVGFEEVRQPIVEIFFESFRDRILAFIKALRFLGFHEQAQKLANLRRPSALGAF